MSRAYAPRWRGECREWTLAGVFNGSRTMEWVALTSGTYAEMRATMAHRKRGGCRALVLMRDIPLAPPYRDGSQDSRTDSIAITSAFTSHGYGMPRGHYWER